MHIRSMKQDDAPAVCALAERLAARLTTDAARHLIADIAQRQDHLAIVAESEDRIIGFLHAYERLAFEKPVEVVVQAIAVAEHRQGEGVGGALMEAAEEWTRQRERQSVSLHTRNARDFYSLRGFAHIATPHFMRKQV